MAKELASLRCSGCQLILGKDDPWNKDHGRNRNAEFDQELVPLIVGVSVFFLAMRVPKPRGEACPVGTTSREFPMIQGC